MLREEHAEVESRVLGINFDHTTGRRKLHSKEVYQLFSTRYYNAYQIKKD